jgi:ATP-dependent DNA helicase RecQ
VVAAVLAGRDALVVMPTGAGKSATYQLPALLIDGPTLVVSPLLALQRDQVERLEEHADLAEDGTVVRAVTVNSEVGVRDRAQAFEDLAAGRAEFLFLAPEQLANDAVLEQVQALHPSLVAVDEAHCVSLWGHDFRPDYLRLGEFVDALGHPPVIALTATAAPPVRDDIVERLRLRDPFVLVQGFARPNISLEVQRSASREEQQEQVVLLASSSPKPAIVYTGTRKASEDVADALAELGMHARAYHAGLGKSVREEVQSAFMAGDLDVIVATSAFGMGIDKPDVRTVIHATVAGSLDEYYQEVGRAGRDGEPSTAVLFYRQEDLGLRRFFASGSLKLQDLQAVAAAAATTGGDREEVARRTGFGPRKLPRLISALADAGGDPEAAFEAGEARQRLERTRVEMMRGYAETAGCRRQFILGYFGETTDEPCGNCDNCRAGLAQEMQEQGEEGPYAIQSAVRHASFGDGVVMSYEGPDRVVVLFETEGYKVLDIEAVTSHGLLEAAG